jgi:hypothetical protein
MEKFLTTQQIAERYGVSQRTANHWCLQKRFPNALHTVKTGIGRIWLVPESDLDGFEPPARGRPRKDDSAEDLT